MTSEATHDGPWPPKVTVPEARSILVEFIAGCDSHDLARLYSAAAEKPIALMWEGREYIVRSPEGEESGGLERTVRLRNAVEDLLAACHAVNRYWKGGVAVDGGSEPADQVRSAIAKAEGRGE